MPLGYLKDSLQTCHSSCCSESTELTSAYQRSLSREFAHHVRPSLDLLITSDSHALQGFARGPPDSAEALSPSTMPIHF